MTAHTNHPSTLEHGLADDCPRCAEHAEHPLQSLDHDHVADLWRRMLAVEFDPFGDHDLRYRTAREAQACWRLADYARFLLLIDIAPAAVVPGRTYAPRERAIDPIAVPFADIAGALEAQAWGVLVLTHRPLEEPSSPWTGSATWQTEDSRAAHDDEPLSEDEYERATRTEFRAAPTLRDCLASLREAVVRVRA